MDYNCVIHQQTATAFCSVHKLTLCTKCFIENTHKETDCTICEITDISDKDKIYLNAQNVEEVIREKTTELTKEKDALEDLRASLETRVEDHYKKLVKVLDEKKKETIAVLKTSIEKKLSRNKLQSDNLKRLSSEVSKYSQEQKAKQYDVVRQELKKLRREIEDIPVQILEMKDGQFTPFDEKTVYKQKALGAFDFEDDIYTVVHEEHNDEGADKNRKPEEQTEEDSSDIYESPPNVKKIEIESTGHVGRKLDGVYVLKEGRFLVLDSANDHVLIVDSTGKVVNYWPGKDEHKLNIACWCIIKKDKIAILGFEGEEPLLIQIKVLSKDTFQSKNKMKLCVPIESYGQDVKSLSFDDQSSTYAIVLKDRIINVQLQKGKPVQHIIDAKLVGSTNHAKMTYDFQGDALYILDKEANMVKRYDCKTNTVTWRLQSSTDSIQFKPLAMEIDKAKRNVRVACTTKIIWVNQEDGKLLQEEQFTFYPDLLTFCNWGDDVMTTRDPAAGGDKSAARTLYLQPIRVKPDKPKVVYKRTSSNQYRL